MQFRRVLPLFAACGRTDAMSGDRVAPGDQQIRETQQHRDALRVLRQAPVAHLAIPTTQASGRQRRCRADAPGQAASSPFPASHHSHPAAQGRCGLRHHQPVARACQRQYHDALCARRHRPQTRGPLAGVSRGACAAQKYPPCYRGRRHHPLAAPTVDAVMWSWNCRWPSNYRCRAPPTPHKWELHIMNRLLSVVREHGR